MLRYIAVHAKDPTFLNHHGGSNNPDEPPRFRYHLMGLHGSAITDGPPLFRYHELGQLDPVTLFLG